MARRIQRLKKKPLIVICSEGGQKSSEYYYFRNFKTRDLRIQFSTGNNTDPKGMLNNFLDYIKNEDIDSEDNCRKFLLFDTDLDEKRIKEIIKIREKCKKHNIEIIISAPTFEIWYIMHFRDNKLIFSSSQKVKLEVGKLLNCEYIESMDVYKLVKSKQAFAVEVAKNVEKKNLGINSDVIYSNPVSDIYKIIEAITELSNE